MRLSEGGNRLTGMEGNPGYPGKTAANMGKGAVLPALRKAREESPLWEAKVTLGSPELDYAMPSDMHKTVLLEGLVANVITMKKDQIFQQDGFLYETRKGHGLPLCQYVGQQKVPGLGTGYSNVLDN